ncbi:MAG: hypothetical protein ACF8GE_03080 [Phycisphaerales bacterium JB043]
MSNLYDAYRNYYGLSRDELIERDGNEHVAQFSDAIHADMTRDLRAMLRHVVLLLEASETQRNKRGVVR